MEKKVTKLRQTCCSCCMKSVSDNFFCNIVIDNYSLGLCKWQLLQTPCQLTFFLCVNAFSVFYMELAFFLCNIAYFTFFALSHSKLFTHFTFEKFCMPNIKIQLLHVSWLIYFHALLQKILHMHYCLCHYLHTLFLICNFYIH